MSGQIRYHIAAAAMVIAALVAMPQYIRAIAPGFLRGEPVLSMCGPLRLPVDGETAAPPPS